MCETVASEDPSLMVYFSYKYKTQRMCDKAVDNCLPALKLVPDWCVTSKIIKNFLLLCMEIKIYSDLMKVLVMLHLNVVEWVFLI